MILERIPHNISRTAAFVVDLDAIAHNYRFIKSRLKTSTECASVVKCDAYGLGAVAVAFRLWQEGCRHFFVACLDEGIELRKQLPKAHIYILSAITSGAYKSELEAHNLIPVLGSFESIEHWNNYAKAKDKPLKAVLHFDTNMTRTGLLSTDTENLCLTQVSHLEICMVMSHLSHSTSFSAPQNRQQLLAFDEIRHRFPIAPASLANSGGIFLGEKFHMDMVRPGIGLFGGLNLSPQLKPAAHLFAQIIEIDAVPQGQYVGYDSTYVTPYSTRIATLGIGYGDGLLRSLGNKGSVVLHGKRIPIVGNISMDLTTIHVGDHPCQVGDWVEIYGDALPITQQADAAGTISYELLTSINKRPERLYIHNEEIFERSLAS